MINYLYQEQIQSLDSQMDSTSGDNVREDAMSKVLGKRQTWESQRDGERD